MRNGLIFLLFSATALSAQQPADSAAFIIRLGNDTTSVERYVRTGQQLAIEAVQRSPSTTLHRLLIDFDRNQNPVRAEYTLRRPGETQWLARRITTYAGDSATVVTEQGGQTRTQRVAARQGLPMAGPFYAPYELVIMRAVRGANMKSSVQLLAGTNLVDIPVERVARDSVALNNQFGEPMRAHIDQRGRLLHLHTPAYTTVERLKWVNLEQLAADFAQRDATGKGMGMLSPRQTYRVSVGGANIWIDYSRPGMRGRPIWGALVPYDRVWRTGANEAAHLSTDRTLQFGDVTLTPGTYTLFLVPSANEWSLIFNRQTGMSGLDYDASQDVGKVTLSKEATSQPVEWFTISVNDTEAGGTLAFAWDRKRASVPFNVR